MTITGIILFFVGILFAIASGICDAIRDTLDFHFDISIFKDKNQYFWNPESSWCNKYKDCEKDKGEKFWGHPPSLCS